LTYRFPVILSLSTDVVQNSDVENDYCLATPNPTTNQWECSTRNLVSVSEANQLSYNVIQDGVYTVIFSPTPIQAVVAPPTCGWLCQNGKEFAFITVVSVVVVSIIAYVMWRMIRYMIKYRRSKKDFSKFEEQIDEL